jgi:hypothetical protein
MVYVYALNTDAARLSDLSTAFGIDISKLPGVDARITAAREAYAGRSFYHMEESQGRGSGLDEGTSSSSSSSVSVPSLASTMRGTLARCYRVLTHVLELVANIITPGESAALVQLFADRGNHGDTSSLIDNAGLLLESLPRGLERRTVFSLLATTMTDTLLHQRGLTPFVRTREAARGRADFQELQAYGRLHTPRYGLTRLSEEVVERAVLFMLQRCAQAAWRKITHNLSRDIVLAPGEDPLPVDEGVFTLPALLRSVGRPTKWLQYVDEFEAGDRMGQTTFRKLISVLTRKEVVCLRALDYFLADLLLEPFERIKGILADLILTDPREKQALLRDLDLVYKTL